MADTAEPPRTPGTPPGFRQLLERADLHMDAIEQHWSAFLKDEEQVGAVLINIARLQATAAVMSGIVVKAADDLSRTPSLSIAQLEAAARTEPPKEGQA